MLLGTPNRLVHPLPASEPITPRRDSSDARQAFARTFGATRRGSAGDQAAIVEFGQRALDLAHADDEGDGEQPPASPRRPGSGRTAARSASAAPDTSAAAGGSFATAASAATASAVGLTGSTDRTGVDSRDEDEDGADPLSVEDTVFAADQLTGAEDQRVRDLRERDREVRTHEQAHKTAGGAHAGSVRLTYQMGPDGKRYAVEGSVPIDVSPVAGDPAATLRKMEVVQRAATAPGEPSSADRQVAAQAQRVTQRARAQLAAERYARARELIDTGR